MAIKLVVFDLDGVLVDAREIHYESLNTALKSCGEEYVISRDEHLAKYDGLSTSKKLKILAKEKGLPAHLHDEIWSKKQKETLKIIDQFTPDYRVIEILKELKEKGIAVACATNSIRDTAKLQLIRKGFFEYIDYMYSNQDVENSKPHPEIYMKCMLRNKVSPHETLIVEDSHHGRKAAIESGAHLCAVIDSKDVTMEKIFNCIREGSQSANVRPRWQGGKMNVLIPMAGAGSRFEKAGYTFPKPLIEVGKRPMIQVVVENLNIQARHIFVTQKSHYEKYSLKNFLGVISPGCEIVQVDGVTEGAACTTLLAKDLINNDDPLLFANSDQFLDWDSNEFMYSMMADGIDAGMLTFESTHPKWSFAEIDESGYVTRVAEKDPISNIATAGIYFWRRGSDYVKYAEEMIEKNIRFNNEFYVCPVFNQAIEDGKKVKIFQFDGMWGIGTPEDLNYFLKNHE